jgi:hypothetical protein
MNFTGEFIFLMKYPSPKIFLSMKPGMKRLFPLVSVLFPAILSAALEVTVTGRVNSDPTGQTRVGMSITFTFPLNPDPDAGQQGAVFDAALSAWYRDSTAGTGVFTGLSSQELTGTLSLEDEPSEPIELLRVRPGGEFDLRLRSDHESRTGLSYGIYPVIEVRVDLKSDIAFIMPGSPTAMEAYLVDYAGNYTANEGSFISIQTSGGGTVTLDGVSFSIGEPPPPPEATFEYTIVDGEVTITKYNCDALPGAEIAIPATIEGLPVTRIGYRAFYQCLELFSVVVPDSVTVFDEQAFGGSGLTSIVIPDSVTELGYACFNGCRVLTTVVIGDGITTIPEFAFQSCLELDDVTFGSQVMTIDKGAFQSTGLTNLAIPDTVTFIGDQVFYASELTQITVPDSVTSLGLGAFASCAALERVVIGDGVPAIADLTFLSCLSLSEVILGKGISSIGLNAFGQCISLKELILPALVASLGDGVFASCLFFEALYCLGAPPTAGDYLFSGTSASIKVYYIEGYPGWPDSYDTAPTEAFDPDWLWGRYEYVDVGPTRYVDSGGWLGWLDVTFAPWTWHLGASSWLYITEPVAAANSGWLYIPNFVPSTPDLWIVREGETDYAFSYGLGKWVYIYPGGSGWIYLIGN